MLIRRDAVWRAVGAIGSCPAFSVASPLRIRAATICSRRFLRQSAVGFLIVFWLGQASLVFGQSNSQPAIARQPAIVELEGTVEISTAGSTTWTSAHTNEILRAGDRVRT